jgi:thioredoxin 1
VSTLRAGSRNLFQWVVSGSVGSDTNRSSEVNKGERETAMSREIGESEWREEVLESPLPVMLDVYGDYCPPCRALAPSIEKLAEEFAGRAKVLKLEVGKSPQAAAELGVTAVPTVIAFRNGQETGRLIGQRPESAYRKLMENAGVS